MVCGQATGVAAALAACRNVETAAVPIRDIQRGLLEQDAYLGTPERLKQLGLS